MACVSSSALIEKCLIQIKSLFPSSTNEVTKEIENLLEIIQTKESQNTEEIVNKLNSKLSKRKKKEDEINERYQKLSEYIAKELTFKNNMILENCSLIIQQQQQHYEVLSKEKLIHDHKVSLNEKELKNTKEKLEEIISKTSLYFENSRINHTLQEKDKRSEWLATKEILSETLLRYDTEMIEQQNEMEFIQNVKEIEKKELEDFKSACASQKIIYYQLMKEKEDYLEEERQKKLYEIRLKFAKRTIVKFVEQHYPAWKKRKLRASKKKSKYRFNPKPIQQKK